MASPRPSTLPARSRLAIGVGRTVAGASKLSHLGSGSVIGGRVAMALDPRLLTRVLAGRRVVLVSGTNGKTTTTHLLAAGLATMGPVATNDLGANMAPGIVAALGAMPAGGSAALEVDEQWLPPVLDAAGRATVVLLNLSRDQLDRAHEVRRIADLWRAALASRPTDLVVANTDDPLIVWAATGADEVVWVSTGARWTLDAAGCPRCGGRIAFTEAGWHCSTCPFARPEPAWWVQSADPRSGDTGGPGPVDGSDAAVLVGADGSRRALPLSLPGRVNAGNAAMALATVAALGGSLDDAVAAVGRVRDVAGRYRQAIIGGVRVRMLLAKNPAGWQEAISMAAPPPIPVVAAINARIADGRDPSWLWDVPFERLRGRLVVAAGERRHDLAVRLRYAEVDHTTADDLTEAVRRAADPTGSDRVELIANYTAFQDYLAEVGGPTGGAPSDPGSGAGRG